MKTYPIKALIDKACSCNALTHSAIARKAGVSRETLYRIMRGEGKRASVETVCGIAKAAGIAPVVLLRMMYNDLDTGALTLLPVREDGDHVSFLSDVTIPDRSMVMAGQRFVKTWAIQNTGNVEWRGRKLKCIDSELVTARWVKKYGKRVLVPDVSPGLKPEKTEVSIPRTASGESVKVSVTFRAPELPCDVISRWKMVDRGGELCFPQHSGLSCVVSVVAI
jgi:transcriptional regulator with XRE-family HTH domain